MMLDNLWLHPVLKKYSILHERLLYRVVKREGKAIANLKFWVALDVSITAG